MRRAIAEAEVGETGSFRATRPSTRLRSAPGLVLLGTQAAVSPSGTMSVNEIRIGCLCGRARGRVPSCAALAPLGSRRRPGLVLRRGAASPYEGERGMFDAATLRRRWPATATATRRATGWCASSRPRRRGRPRLAARGRARRARERPRARDARPPPRTGRRVEPVVASGVPAPPSRPPA